ncbi:MAG: cupin domain-containing protein [Verrucomicrobiales bacterium]
MKTPDPFTVIHPGDLQWRLSNLMRIPNADLLERTGSTAMGARLWRLPPMSANTLHKHISSEEFYFVLEGTGRMRVGRETLTIRKHGGVHVMPEQVRQVFNDTDEDVLWLIFGAPDDELLPAKGGVFTDFYPVDPKTLPPELDGAQWPNPD